MKVEWMLYAYLGICVAMILFNIASIFAFKVGDKKHIRRVRRFDRRLRIEVLRTQNGLELNDDHLKFLEKKLKKVGNLLAFDDALWAIKTQGDNIAPYLEKTYSVFLRLAFIYKDMSSMKAAYYPYVLSKYRLLSIKKFDMLRSVIAEYLYMPNFFCRQNAINAIFSSSSFTDISTALHTVDSLPVYHNKKLLTEGILNYTDNKEPVCCGLLNELSSFSPEMQVAIVNLCRLSGDSFAQPLLNLLQNDETEDELRFACIRYFSTHPHKEALNVLLKLNNPDNTNRWEYTAVTSTALAGYPCENVVESLKRNLHSPVWYVRLNSADSLEKLGLHYKDLIDIFEGNDRYAREIMQYRLDVREIKVG